jgi:hypothetical protein
MHRAILQSCFPYFLWLLAGFAALWLVARVSGAKLTLGRLRTLHRSQEGSVQTLSFVLTLPLFMMIVLFIVQVSQLMIGITIVHYAAFAAARAASVWLPAHMPPYELANSVGAPGQSLPGWIPPPSWQTPVLNYGSTNNFPSWKCQKIWTAAVMACYPIAPSKPYLNPAAMQSMNGNRIQTTTTLYQALVPSAGSNPMIPSRLMNKAAYAAEHTSIQISGHDYDDQTVTYNPIGHPNPTDPMSPEYNFPESWQFKPNEIGWQDPITVQVWFRFPLLTGPGRFLSPGHFLSAQLAPPDGTPDKVSSRIQVWKTSDHPNYRENLYWTQLTATATITSEGLISIIPYVHQPENIN